MNRYKIDPPDHETCRAIAEWQEQARAVVRTGQGDHEVDHAVKPYMTLANWLIVLAVALIVAALAMGGGW